MVAAAVLAGALHRQEIVRFLDDAEEASVAPRVVAETAGVLVGDVEARPAVDDLVLHRDERLGELAHFVGGALQEEEGQALRRLGPDPGEPLECVDQPRDRLRVIRQRAGPTRPGPGSSIHR